MPEIRGLAEIVLNVRDRERSLSFYRDMLGLSVISTIDSPGPLFLQAGESIAEIPQMIVLVELPDSADSFQAPSHLHHMALTVDPEDFDALWQRFESYGMEVRTGQHPVIPSRTLYVDDPDGNEVEIICRSED
jgi:catechol-2,3-dioxygenase